MASESASGPARAVRVVAWVAAALLGAATFDAWLVYALCLAERPDGYSVGSFLVTFSFTIAAGGLPLLVAAFLAGVLASPASRSKFVGRLSLVAGMGMLPAVVGGFISGLGASEIASGGEAPSALAAYDLYQYILVAAVLADALLFVIALVARRGGLSAPGPAL